MNNLSNKRYYPWLLVIVYSLMGITIPATVTQFSMTVPDLAAKFAVSQQLVLLGDTIRSSCLVLGMFLSGAICSKLGLRKSIALGLSIQIIPQLMIPFASNIYMFMVLKALQGFNSIAFPLYIAAIVMWIDSGKKGLATAIFNGSFSAGSGFGAAVAGFVIPRFGWQASYLAIGTICLVFACIAVFVTRDKDQSNRLKPLDNAKEAVGFTLYRRVVAMPSTWLMVISVFGCNWVLMAVTVDMPIYSAHLNYSLETVGLMMVAVSVVTIISSLIGGMVSDYFAVKSSNSLLARSVVLSAGYILSAVFGVMLPVTASKDVIFLVLATTMMVFGASWVQGAFWAIPSEVYSKDIQVVGTGFCSGASNLSNPLAPVVVGVLLGLQGFWTAAWISCAVISVLSLLTAVQLAIFHKNKLPKISEVK